MINKILALFGFKRVRLGIGFWHHVPGVGLIRTVGRGHWKIVPLDFDGETYADLFLWRHRPR